MLRYQGVHGARDPSDEMKASMHARFYGQIRQVPGLEHAMQWHELSTDLPGTGMRIYQWLLLQKLTGPPDRWDERGRRGRTKNLCHGGGGPSLRLPADKTASGRTTGETTCKFAKQGKHCPEAGQSSPYNRKKP
eukprot:2988286-Pyramimonas_sp.AAC.2